MMVEDEFRHFGFLDNPFHIIYGLLQRFLRMRGIMKMRDRSIQINESWILGRDKLHGVFLAWTLNIRGKKERTAHCFNKHLNDRFIRLRRTMTNGRGFVALAIMIFGKWTPLGAWGAALLFGLASAVQTQLQFQGQINIPHQFIGMLPYLLTVLVLAGFVGRSRAPAALGKPYEKEQSA